MTVSELNKQLDNALVAYLKSEGYVDSGKLVNSIQFTCTYSDTNGLNLSLNAEPYIVYLKDGTLLDSFFNLNSVVSIFEDFIFSNLENN